MMEGADSLTCGLVALSEAQLKADVQELKCM
jgi:hypothetical protein